MINTVATKVLQRLSGKTKYQPFFERMLVAALEGLNFYNAVNVNESGEINVITELEKHLRPDRNFVLFDVGANKGQFLDLLLSKVAAGKIEAHVFEPQRAMYEELLRKYAARPNFILNHLAVDDKPAESATLYTCKGQPLVASIYDFPISRFSKSLGFDATEKVGVITLDDYCRKHGISHIDFLKLDVEGAEYQALAPLMPMVRAGHIDFIQFEYCFINMVNRNYYFDFWDLLSPFYTIYRVVRDGLIEIKEYRILDEQMAPINYLAARKNK